MQIITGAWTSTTAPLPDADAGMEFFGIVATRSSCNFNSINFINAGQARSRSNETFNIDDIEFVLEPSWPISKPSALARFGRGLGVLGLGYWRRQCVANLAAT